VVLANDEEYHAACPANRDFVSESHQPALPSATRWALGVEGIAGECYSERKSDGAYHDVGKAVAREQQPPMVFSEVDLRPHKQRQQHQQQQKQSQTEARRTDASASATTATAATKSHYFQTSTVTGKTSSGNRGHSPYKPPTTKEVWTTKEVLKTNEVCKAKEVRTTKGIWSTKVGNKKERKEATAVYKNEDEAGKEYKETRAARTHQAIRCNTGGGSSGAEILQIARRRGLQEPTGRYAVALVAAAVALRFRRLR
jgi:hypothetical protein